MKNKRSLFTSVLLVTLVFSTVAGNFFINEEVLAARSITFPVIGPTRFSNDYNAPRGNRTHHAIDILANKGQRLVAAVSGTITRVNYPQPSWGYAITIEDSDGYSYSYLHMNDDRAGTDDGRGGGMRAYGVDMKVGNPVVRGQHIGWVGNSGNSNGVPHLHFEMEDPSGNRVNPYSSLLQARRISAPANYPQLPTEVLPYSRNFVAGISVAMGNFDGDPESEFVTGAGPGGGPHVKIYDDDSTQIKSFFAYNSRFLGGVDVGSGDVDGDGIDEIITGPYSRGGPHVKAFKADGTQILSWFAYNSQLTIGLRVDGGDVDDDGTDEIITGLGPGGGPHLKALKADRTLVSSFYAYSKAFDGGFDVTSADVTGSNEDEIITGTGPGASTHVRVLSKDGIQLASIGAYPGNRWGVRVSAADVRPGVGKAEILTIPAGNGPPYVKIWNGDGNVLDGIKFIESWWVGSYDIAAGFDTSKAAAGWNRRASVRDGIE